MLLSCFAAIIIIVGLPACLIPACAVRAQTVTQTLLSANFAVGTIFNPLYTATTARGGTIVAEGGSSTHGRTDSAARSAHLPSQVRLQLFAWAYNLSNFLRWCDGC